MGFHFHDCFKKCFDGGDPTMRGILKPFGAPVTRRRGDAADGATRSPLKGGVGPYQVIGDAVRVLMVEKKGVWGSHITGCELR